MPTFSALRACSFALAVVLLVSIMFKIGALTELEEVMTAEKQQVISTGVRALACARTPSRPEAPADGPRQRVLHWAYV